MCFFFITYTYSPYNNFTPKDIFGTEMVKFKVPSVIKLKNTFLNDNNSS